MHIVESILCSVISVESANHRCFAFRSDCPHIYISTGYQSNLSLPRRANKTNKTLALIMILISFPFIIKAAPQLTRLLPRLLKFNKKPLKNGIKKSHSQYDFFGGQGILVGLKRAGLRECEALHLNTCIPD
jgi:hypothetical protein